jgi:hypothetical protein
MRFPSVLALFLQLGLLFVAATLPSQLRASDQPNAPALSPDVVSKQFYQFYVKAVSANANPLKTDKAKMAAYVAPALLQEIEKKSKSPDGLDADYFLQAQDVMEDWATHVQSKIKTENNSEATIEVTLGNKEKYHLAVSMLKSAGGWKIRKVKGPD